MNMPMVNVVDEEFVKESTEYDFFYSRQNQARLLEAIRDLENGRNIISKPISEFIYD